MALQRTNKHSLYEKPRDLICRQIIEENGFDDSEAYLLDDISNIASHNKFLSKEEAFVDPSEWEKTGATKDEIDFALGCQKIAKELDLSQEEGSPLDQSLKYVHAVKAKAKCKGKCTKDFIKEVGEGQPGNLSELSKEIRNFQKLVDVLPNAIKLLLEISLGDPYVYEKLILTPDIVEVLKMKNKLNKAINGTGNSKYKRITGDKRTGYKQMEWKDVGKLATSLVRPDYLYKLATKSYHVEDRFSVKEIETLDIILEDDSGSMSESYKQNWCNAIVLSRLERVINGESQLLFYSFETSIYNKHHITTPEQAKEFWNIHLKHKPNKGGTDVQNAIKQALKEIESFNLALPNILIVNDGQDRVDANLDVENCIVHAVTIGRVNENLQKVCLRSKGAYINVNKSDK